MKRNKGTLFLIGILLVGIFTLLPYGFYLDQTSEQRILFANIKEYLLYLPGDASGLIQDFTDFQVLEISIDEDRDHGMAVYYPAFPVWYINQVSPYAGSIFWHAYTFLLVFWGMCSLFYLGKELFHNEGVSAFLVLLFFLTPRMFAESHYNNKDVVLLSLAFTLFYWGKRLMKDQSVKSVCMLSIVGALAANMKIIGAWMFGALGLYILFYFIVTKQFHRKLFAKTVGCILLWVVAYVLLTPACWTNTAEFFQYLFFNAVDYNLWHDYVLFGGRMLHQDLTGMPKKYLPVLMALTIPVGILLLTLLGSILAMVDFVRKKGKCLEDVGYVLVIIFIGAVPLVYAVLAATPLYNGWRHFYFVYASMIVAAGYGAFRLWETAKSHSTAKSPGDVKGSVNAKQFGREVFIEAAAVLYLLALVVGICINYPQEHSYYNFLAGKNVLERYELDYWDMSVKQAYESVLKQAGGVKTTVGALNLPTRWGLDGNLKVLPKKAQEMISIAEEWKEAEYVIVNTTYAYMYTNDDYIWVKENYELTDSFTSYGNVICEIYHRGENY